MRTTWPRECLSTNFVQRMALTEPCVLRFVVVYSLSLFLAVLLGRYELHKQCIAYWRTGHVRSLIAYHALYVKRFICTVRVFVHVLVSTVCIC